MIQAEFFIISTLVPGNVSEAFIGAHTLENRHEKRG